MLFSFKPSAFFQTKSKPEETRLHRRHTGARARGVIFKSGQVKKPMQQIESQLPAGGGFKLTCLSPRGFRADDNFAVVKSEHIRCSQDI